MNRRKKAQKAQKQANLEASLFAPSAPFCGNIPLK